MLKEALYTPPSIALALGVQINGHRVTRKSQLPLLKLARRVLTKEHFSIADQIDVLGGYTINPLKGVTTLAGCLKEFKERPGILFVANHFHECPIGVGGNAIALIHTLKYHLQQDLPKDKVKDPYVAAGIGRLGAISQVVKFLEASCNAIPVGKKTGGAKKIQTKLTEGGWVLNYVERTNSVGLVRGSEGGGISVYLAARQGAAVVPAAIWFEDKKVNIDLGEPLNRKKILFWGNEQQIDGQSVSDYALREGVRPLLPKGLWGVYK